MSYWMWAERYLAEAGEKEGKERGTVFRAYVRAWKQSGRDNWGRHLSAHAHALGGEINEEFVRGFPCVEKRDDELRQTMTGTREQAHVGPGIDILFDRKEGGLTGCDPAA